MKHKSLFLVACLILGSQVIGQLDIDRSRQNAVTNAIEKASPAVASINVTEIQRFAVSPFQRDPWFEYFFPPRNSTAGGERIRIRCCYQS